MKEQWAKWEPIKGLSSKYYIDSISDNIKEFRVILSDTQDEKKKVHVVFENSVDAYRSTDESFRLDMLYSIDKQYGTKFYAEWTFFKVTNSQYLTWISEQSFGITNNLHFIHFSFLAVDSVLDILTTYEPKVEIVG